MSEDLEIRHTGRLIEDEIRIQAPPEAVYRAWSEPELVSAWFIHRMEGQMEVGETVRWLWNEPDPGMSHRVLVADPPRRLVTEMALPQGLSLLEVTVEQDEGYSVVRLVQSGFGVGPDWDDQYEGMLSGWMVALALLKFFAERYFDSKRKEVVVLTDVAFEREQVLDLQRSERGLARWLTRSGAPGDAVGEPVRLVLENGQTLTGTVLRNTSFETLWSWDEIEGTVELKAFKGAHWGSKVGVRISSWMEDVAELADLEGWLTKVVEKLAGALIEDLG